MGKKRGITYFKVEARWWYGNQMESLGMHSSRHSAHETRHIRSIPMRECVIERERRREREREREREIQRDLRPHITASGSVSHLVFTPPPWPIERRVVAATGISKRSTGCAALRSICCAALLMSVSHVFRRLPRSSLRRWRGSVAAQPHVSRGTARAPKTARSSPAFTAPGATSDPPAGSMASGIERSGASIPEV